MSSILTLLGEESASGGSAGLAGGIGLVLVYVVVFGAFIYFLMIRPQKKQQTQMQDLLSKVETGDSVLTTSGFYGVVIDINDDIVIVEFGNNKNCRIPMQKSAIVDVEKASDGYEK